MRMRQEGGGGHGVWQCMRRSRAWGVAVHGGGAGHGGGQGMEAWQCMGEGEGCESSM